MHLQIIVGSIREGRASLPIAQWAHDEAAARGDFTTELVDLKTWNLPPFALAKPPILGDYEDELQRRWAASVARADAFVFVSPEYNHSFTPALKNALDYVYAEWNRKPAAFISFGQSMGARSIEQLSLVLLELRMVPLAQAVQLRDVYARIREGRFKPEPGEVARLHKVLDELAWWGASLESARARPVESRRPAPRSMTAAGHAEGAIHVAH